MKSNGVDCGAYKKFSKNLFDKYDSHARNIVIEFLKRHGMNVGFNSNQYGIDLVDALRSDPNFKIECETRRANHWAGQTFKYDPINIPGRKYRWLKDGKSHYFIVSEDGTTLGIAHKVDIKAAIDAGNLAENPNCFVKDGEKFIQIPRAKWKFYDVTTGAKLT